MLPAAPGPITRRSAFPLLAAMLGAGCRPRPPGFSGQAFVANQEGRSVALVDFDPFRVAKLIRLPAAPTALLAHPSLPVAYVLTPSDGMVYEIDGERQSIARKVHVGHGAVALRLERHEPQIPATAFWVLASGQRRMLRIPFDSLRSDSHIAVGPGATGFDLSLYTSLAAVSYAGSGTVQMVDLRNRKAGVSVRVSEHTGEAVFRSDGNAVMVANLAGRTLTMLTAPEGKVMAHLPLAVRPDNLCVSRDGGQLFITGEGRDAVVVVYPHYVPQVAETALAGKAPGPMTVSSRYLLVTSPSTGELIVMNIETRRVIAITAVGAEPRFIAVTPNDAYALVLNRASGDMAVIRLGAITPNRQKAAALFTMVPVGSMPVAAVVTSA